MNTLCFNLRILIAVLCTHFVAYPGIGLSADDDTMVAQQSHALLFGTKSEFKEAVLALRSRGKPDVAAAMILAIRYTRDGKRDLSTALQAITHHTGTSWFDWMVWQQSNPHISPHPSYTGLKLQVLASIDQNFLQFFKEDWAQPTSMKIRLEEITWGGVRVDSIPSLDPPKMIAAAEANYLLDDDLVFGLDINGDTRAYPLRIMGWHEMFNDVIGGVPVALAYCTLCGAGIVFETQPEGREQPFVFGSSGMLYRSNKLMFDRQTNSLWNQFTGQPVVGPLVKSDVQLTIRPVTITSWAEWHRLHPHTTVLSVNTGYSRDYGSDVVYREYFASTDLMFPVKVNEMKLRQKDYIFGIRDVGAAKAWPLSVFSGGAVINDTVGFRDIVLIGDAAKRTVRAYDRKGKRFQPHTQRNRLQGPEGLWDIQENALVGPDGTRLNRVPGHISYWFAWDGYLGIQSQLYTPENN